METNQEVNKGKIIEDSSNIDSEVDEGGIGVDWEGMYEAVKLKLSDLIREGKDNSEEYEEEIKRLRDIPKEERIKIVRRIFEKVGRTKAVSDEEAVRKYIGGEEKQKKCLEILEGVRRGKVEIISRNEYSSKGFFGRKKIKEGNYLLTEAAKQAIEADDLPSLKALSKGCSLPNPVSILNKYSLFEYSLRIHADDCALYLLEEGGGIEQVFYIDERPLHQALRGRNEEISTFLIERGADVKAKGINGVTPAHYAVLEGSYEVFQLLIERGPDIEAKTEYYGQTPLHMAACGNRVEFAQLLIDRGANIEAKDIDDMTPLHNAAKWNIVEVAQLLIDRGADIEAKDKYRFTPLHYAVDCDRTEMAQLLIDRGADIEAKGIGETTPLHNAVSRNRVEVAQLLIDRGADIEARNKNGFTPLHSAVQDNKFEVTQLLIDRGADIEAKDNEGKTPLQKTNNNLIKEMIKEVLSL